MEFCQDLDIAIVKATNHVECPPKERYLRSEWFLFLGVGCKQIPHMAISNSGSPNVARFYFIYLFIYCWMQRYSLRPRRIARDPMLVTQYVHWLGDYPRPRTGLWVYADGP